jgi:hypothetical protein
MIDNDPRYGGAIMSYYVGQKNADDEFCSITATTTIQHDVAMLSACAPVTARTVKLNQSINPYLGQVSPVLRTRVTRT